MQAYLSVASIAGALWYLVIVCQHAGNWFVKVIGG